MFSEIVRVKEFQDIPAEDSPIYYVCKIFRTTKISHPVICTSSCANHGVRQFTNFTFANFVLFNFRHFFTIFFSAIFSAILIIFLTWIYLRYMTYFCLVKNPVLQGLIFTKELYKRFPESKYYNA